MPRRGEPGPSLDDHYRANNPFEIARTYTIVPAVTRLLRVSDRSWQVRWTEEDRGLDGLFLGKSHWEAALTIDAVPPTAEATLHANPLRLDERAVGGSTC